MGKLGEEIDEDKSRLKVSKCQGFKVSRFLRFQIRCSRDEGFPLRSDPKRAETLGTRLQTRDHDCSHRRPSPDFDENKIYVVI